MISTYERCKVYRNEETLFRDTLIRNPRSWTAHTILGTIAFSRNEIGEAESHFVTALRFKPGYWEALHGLGAVYATPGEPPRARSHREPGRWCGDHAPSEGSCVETEDFRNFQGRRAFASHTVVTAQGLVIIPTMSAESTAPEPSGRRHSRIRWYHKLVALLLPFVLVALAIELALRVTEEKFDLPKDGLVVRSSNPRLIYVYRPSHRVVTAGVEVQTNSAGFRDGEWATPKPEGLYRIAAVGDSVTYGFNVLQEEAFPQLLEQRLSKRQLRVEVLNMGIAGYNSLQEAELIAERVLPLEPDLLVLSYVHNDNKEDGGDGGISRYFNRGHSRALDGLQIRFRRLSRKIGRDVRTEAFERIAALARESNLPVVVVIFPEFRLVDGAYLKQDQHQQVRQLAERLGFRVLDLYAFFEAIGLEAHRMDRVHPTAEGYRLVAERLQAFLEEEGFLSPAN